MLEFVLEALIKQITVRQINNQNGVGNRKITVICQFNLHRQHEKINISKCTSLHSKQTSTTKQYIQGLMFSKVDTDFQLEQFVI